MAENAGAIIYTVDMDTAAVTKGADRVNAALDSVGKGADRLDGSMARTGSSMSKAAKATDAEAAALRKLLGQIDPTVAATQRLDQMTEALGQAFDKGHISAQQYAANLAKLDAQYNKLAGSTDKATASTKKAESGASGFATSLKPLAAAIAGVISVQTLAQWGKLAEQFTVLQVRIARLSPDLETAGRTYQTLLSIASKTGATMQNTAKLWEGLTSTLKDLGATNSQVLALTGTLQKIGAIGGSSADEVARGLRQLQQGLAAGTLRAEEFNSVVENTPELARQLAKGFGMSMGQLRQAMLDGKISAQALFDVLINGTQSVDAEFAKLPRTAAAAGNAVSVAFGAALSKLDQALGASQKLAQVLDALANNVNAISGNLAGQEKLNALLEERADIERQIAFQNQRTFGPSKSRVAELTTMLQGLNAQIKEMQSEKGATGPLKAPVRAPATTTEDGQKAIQQLAEQNQQLRAEGVERAKIIALQKLGAGATQQEKDAAVALAVENFNMQEAEKARTKAAADGAAQRKRDEAAAAAAIKKENEEAQRGYESNQRMIQGLALELANAALKGEELAVAQAKAKLNKFASPEDVAEVERLTRAIVQQQQALANKQLAGQVDPFTGAQQQRDQRLADLQTLEQAELLSVERVNQLKLQAETAYQEQVRALQEETFRQASVGNDILIGTLNQLQQAGTQAFVGLITGASNGQQAVQALAGALLNEAVGALVQMGVQYVKNLIIGQTAAAAATATGIATAGALATAYATPAALASLATFGGNAAPASAGIASTVALAQGLAIGARQYGGPVAAGNLYRVNEGGAPEIFNAAGGKQYMMPNSRGEVVSNKDATAQGGASAAPIVNVNNYSGAPATAQAKFSEADKQWVIDVVVGDMQTGGKTGQTANRITGTRRVGS